EQVFKMHGVEAKGIDCPAIDGIIEEADDIIADVEDKKVPDAALIAAAQAVEHYEITRYGTLIAWAKQLGRPDCASVLQQNLEEEKATDQKLTAIAESKVNQKAAGSKVWSSHCCEPLWAAHSGLRCVAMEIDRPLEEARSLA